MQRVKVTHNFQNKREVPALHESCVQNVKKQPTIALQTFWVKCFSLNHSAQAPKSAWQSTLLAITKGGVRNVGKNTKHKEAAAFQDKMKPFASQKVVFRT